MRPLGFQSYLKVWIGHTSGDLFEQRLLDFNELRWFNDVQNLLNFPKKHHLNLYLKNLKREPVQRRKQTVVRKNNDCRRLYCGGGTRADIPLSGCRFWARTSANHG